MISCDYAEGEERRINVIMMCNKIFLSSGLAKIVTLVVTLIFSLIPCVDIICVGVALANLRMC